MPFNISHYPEIDFYSSTNDCLDNFVLLHKDGAVDAAADHYGIPDSRLACAAREGSKKGRIEFSLYILDLFTYKGYDGIMSMKMPYKLIYFGRTFKFERRRAEPDGTKQIRYRYELSPAGIYRGVYEQIKDAGSLLDQAMEYAKQSHARLSEEERENCDLRLDRVRDSY